MRHLVVIVVVLGLAWAVSATQDSDMHVHTRRSTNPYHRRAVSTAYDVMDGAALVDVPDPIEADRSSPIVTAALDFVYWPAEKFAREDEFVFNLIRSLISARAVDEGTAKNEAAPPPSAFEAETPVVADVHALGTWSGFHRRPLAERHALLSAMCPDLDRNPLLSGGGLPVPVADTLIENCIGTLGLPIGVAPTFVINGRHRVVPMATEEPSVIAAASGAAKLIATSGGGFRAWATPSLMIGQIQLVVPDLEAARLRLLANKAALLADANRICASMAARGGGVRDLDVRLVIQRNPDLPRRQFLVVHVHMDVRDAMGANAVNAVCEGLGPRLVDTVASDGVRLGLRILSNYCLDRRARASFRLPLAALGWKGVEGRAVAERLVDAYELAEADPYRAVTHNKGIMNGVDAVAVATGQDWRALEAAAHAFASRRGYYGSLTRYTIEDEDVLVGEIDLPMAVGTVGGCLGAHGVYGQMLGLLGRPTADELAQVLAAVGLAQNFAALRALATEGIQRGHMQLHARKASPPATM